MDLLNRRSRMNLLAHACVIGSGRIQGFVRCDQFVECRQCVVDLAASCNCPAIAGRRDRTAPSTIRARRSGRVGEALNMRISYVPILCDRNGSWREDCFRACLKARCRPALLAACRTSGWISCTSRYSWNMAISDEYGRRSRRCRAPILKRRRCRSSNRTAESRPARSGNPDLADSPARGLLSCANNLIFCARTAPSRRTDRKPMSSNGG